MIDEPTDEPKLVRIEGDELIFAYGRMVWYFWVDGGLYKVTRPEIFLAFPSQDELLGYRIQDRHRLWQWLKARDRGEAVLHPNPCWGKDENWDRDGFRRPIYPAQRPPRRIPVPPPPLSVKPLPVDPSPPPKPLPVDPIPLPVDPTPPRKPLRRKYNEQYDPWYFEERAKEHEAAESQKQRRAAALNEVRREQEGGVSMERRYFNAFRPESQYKYRRPGHMASAEACGEMISTFLSDHHYIQAMFDVYTQQRTRLL